MARGLRVAVVGAAGLVGREILAIMEERGFPIGQLIALATERSAGDEIELEGERVQVRKADAGSFAGVELVLMAAGPAASRELTPAAVAQGAVVIDTSSAWRMDPDVPLVIPEVNAADIAAFDKKSIISSPSAATIQLLVAVAPLHREAVAKRIVVATYEAVSRRGQGGMDELGAEVTALFGQREFEPKVFPKRVAFNAVPQVGAFLPDGFTREESRLVEESRKILHVPELRMCATCVHVPVFNGHAESVVVEFDKPMSAERARQLLREAPGIMLKDDPATADYPTPIDAEGTDATYVGRLRDDPSAANSLAFWCVADNVRKGAAANTVQIAEIWARDHG
jgi:aspartate-semialdehyde dehydrogenase